MPDGTIIGSMENDLHAGDAPSPASPHVAPDAPRPLICRSPRGRFGRRLALFAFGLLGGLAIGEVTVRLLNLGPQFSPLPEDNYRICDDPVLRYELLPESTYLGTRINSDGMRDRERDLTKPPKTFRIACLGDSVTFGLYVRQEEVFSRRLESLLNETLSPTGTMVEVLNFGVTGYNITQNVAALRLHALKYDPDLVLLGYCLNDPNAYSLEFASLRHREVRAKRRYIDEVLHQTNFLAGHLRLYRLAYYAWLAESDAWGWTGELSAPLPTPKQKPWDQAQFFKDLHSPGQGWERVEQGFESLVQIVNRPRIPVFLVLFPVLDQLKDYPLVAVHEKVRAAAELHGFRVIDLLEPLQKAAASSHEPLALDDLHPTPWGHGVVAEAIRQALLDAGALPR